MQDPSGWYGWVEREPASGRYETTASLRTALLGLPAHDVATRAGVGDPWHAELTAARSAITRP